MSTLAGLLITLAITWAFALALVCVAHNVTPRDVWQTFRDLWKQHRAYRREVIEIRDGSAYTTARKLRERGIH